MRGWLNVKFSAFHEGRGAGKPTRGGHDLVNRKNSSAEGKVREERACFPRQNCPTKFPTRPSETAGTWMFSKVENFIVAMCINQCMVNPTNNPRGLDGGSQSSLSRRFRSQPSAVWLEAGKEVVKHKTPILSAG